MPTLFNEEDPYSFRILISFPNQYMRAVFAERDPTFTEQRRLAPRERRIRETKDSDRKDPTNIAYTIGTNTRGIRSDLGERLLNPYGALEANAS